MLTFSSVENICWRRSGWAVLLGPTGVNVKRPSGKTAIEYWCCAWRSTGIFSSTAIFDTADGSRRAGVVAVRSWYEEKINFRLKTITILQTFSPGESVGIAKDLESIWNSCTRQWIDPSCFKAFDYVVLRKSFLNCRFREEWNVVNFDCLARMILHPVFVALFKVSFERWVDCSFQWLTSMRCMWWKCLQNYPFLFAINCNWIANMRTVTIN